MYIYSIHLTLTDVCVVPKLGRLFEVYMEVCSSYSQHRKWTTIVNDVYSDNDTVVPEDKQHELMDGNSNTFIGWLMFHIANIGTHGRRQLFYHTFVAHYFGLSRDGIDTLSRYGYLLPIRSFDQNRDDILLDHVTKVRLVLYNIPKYI